MYQITPVVLLLSVQAACAFAPPPQELISRRAASTTGVRALLLNNAKSSTASPEPFFAQATKDDGEGSDVDVSKDDTTAAIEMPLTFEEMVRQTSEAMTDAYAKGVTRQQIRVLLPRDPSNDQIGQYFENDAFFSGAKQSDLVLVPSDETWQGGAMQLYRAAAPTCREILRRISKSTAGVPPRLVEDRSIDESGVDGIGVWMAQSQTPADDISCFVQPSQETIDSVQTISDQAGDRLVVIMNPQWRNVDDALDAASKKGGVLGGFASFLGGKGASLRRLDDMGFQSTMTIEGYVCRGGNIRMVKRFDSNWVVFAENDSADAYIRVGTSENRPTYQEVDDMLEEKGIALKYARDVGLAPKL